MSKKSRSFARTRILSFATSFVVLILGFTSLATEVIADDQSAQDANTVSPSTPHEFAALYGAASEAMSAEAVAGYYSDTLVSVGSKGAMRVTTGKIQQQAELAAFFTAVKERGITSISLADFTIMEVSNDFAVARLRWELRNAVDRVENTFIFFSCVGLFLTSHVHGLDPSNERCMGSNRAKSGFIFFGALGPGLTLIPGVAVLRQALDISASRAWSLLT
jgi:hypothetical protein